MSFAYIDTSALLKWYVNEAGSDEMRGQRAAFDGWFTSWLSYAEALSAIERRCKDGVLTIEDAQSANTMLVADFKALFVVDVNAKVLAEAGTLVANSYLRGADLVHRATIHWLLHEGAISHFFCSDQRLMNAVSQSLSIACIDPAKVDY